MLDAPRIFECLRVVHTTAMLTAHTIATPAGPIIKLFIPSTYVRLVPDALGIKNCGSADQVPLVRANLLLFQAAQ
jgi:hypothetical protein